MASVQLKPNESAESLLKRFQKQVEDEKIIKEYKDKMYFLKPSAVRRRKNNEQERKAYVKMLKDKIRIETSTNRK